MKYKELLDAQILYGITKNDLLNRTNFDKVHKNVIIAPWWSPNIFDNHNFQIEQINDTLYNLKGNNLEFSFISLKQVGAPAIIDKVLSLGVSKCKNLLFIGSVGSLNENINIGDLVIPKYSICGDGASKYLNKNLEDDFGKKAKPSRRLTELLIKCIKANSDSVNYHEATNFSTDTIFGQFAHIEEIKNMGAKVIEMETYSVFKSASIVNINVTALLCVSDNTIKNKSLYSGRNLDEKNYRRKVREEVIPKIIIDFFNSCD